MRKNRYKKLRLGDKKTLARKIGFTFAMLILFKLLGFIPAPFINTDELFKVTNSLGILDTARLFSGNAFTQMTFMATGVSSYITASIVLQFLTYSFNSLHEISRSSNGEKVMKRITMVLGVVLSLITSLGFTIGFSRQNPEILTNSSWYVFGIIAIFHAIGTIVAITIGEAIKKKGYGNGISLLIAINVVSQVPIIVSSIYNLYPQRPLATTAIVLCTILMLGLIIIVDSSEKRLPVTYTKVIARSYGNNTTQTLPLKINSSGVMPIVLASTIVQLLVFILRFFNNATLQKAVNKISEHGSIYNGALISVLIVVFTFFYSAITFDANEVSEHLRKSGGSILGVRPGRDTRNYLKKINRSLTAISAFYLFVVSLIPIFISIMFDFNGIQATSLMILTGVSLEIIIKLHNEFNLGKMKF